KDPSSVKIICATSKKNSFYTVTPAEASTDPVRIAIPLAELTVSEGECPWNEIAGEVVVNLNQNAVYNILTPGQCIASGKPMIVSAAVTGVFGQKTIGGNVTYLPIKEYSDTTTVYVPGSMVETNETTGKTYVPVTLTAAEGDFVIDGTPVNDIEIISSEAKEIDDDIYRVLIEIPSKKMCATKVTSGRFGVKAGNVTADPKNTYVSYEIYESASELPDEPDPVTEDDENDDELPTGTAPDIWVNGKDIKKEDYYKKTMTKAAASLINSVPDGCKLVTSVTDTTVEDASAAFPSGKGKKSNTAKAAYKKADDAVVVTAGKTEGTVRVWLAAVDKQKKVQASGYFDVTVGIAPKKVYVTKEKDAAVTAAVKSIALNVGDSVKLYANAAGTELSPFSGFTWYTVADTVPLEIERAKNTRSATLKATAVTDTGKVLKIPVILENDESRKRVKFTILVENRIKSITGLSDSLTLDSAVEAAVEKKLDYVPVCVSSNPTTDKIKVYTTAALEEGTGYSNNGKKFSLSSKSKVKVTYKNGEFTLKVPKKTVDGTKCRVLVVVTHGDKTVDVFESGVITIGKQNN
ncbi:MAG: hypothetical protein J6Y89_04110, partial [Lachnospiraceae bacterium]|nr:hypothetical protein [Lachnospiraceae bacterium]